MVFSSGLQRLGSLVLGACLMLVLFGRPASAAEPTPYQPSAPYAAPAPAYTAPNYTAPGSATKTRWYGYQFMLIDAGSLGLSYILKDGSPFALMYAAAPIGLHLIHDRSDLLLISLCLRVALPITFGYIGAKIETCRPNEWFCGLGGFIVGGLVGMGTAMLVDYSISFRKARYPDYAQVDPRPRKGIQLTGAGFAPGKDSASVVLGGTF